MRLGCVTAVEVVGRIAAVVLVVAVGVVPRVHRRRHSRAVAVMRTIAVVVVAVGAGTIVVARAGTYVDDHPALVARPFPEEGDRFEVLESGKAVQLVVQFVVGHDGEGMTLAYAVGRDVDGDALDASGAYFDPLRGVVVAVVRVHVEVNAASVGVVANVLNVVVDGDGVGVVNHHGLRH